VKVFEIWNEPDIPIFWEPAPNLTEFAQIYLYTRAAIHEVDPTATVIIGGLVYASTSLPALYAAEPSLRGNTDGVAIHPYRGTAAAMETAVNYDISLDASTIDAPIYVNEYGWNGVPGTWQGVTEAEREAYTEQATQVIGREPQVVDMEPFCWGCGQDYDSAFELYNTPAGAAYAASIAADAGALALKLLVISWYENYHGFGRSPGDPEGAALRARNRGSHGTRGVRSRRRDRALGG